jgi:hypothetical protein
MAKKHSISDSLKSLPTRALSSKDAAKVREAVAWVISERKAGRPTPTVKAIRDVLESEHGVTISSGALSKRITSSK